MTNSKKSINDPIHGLIILDKNDGNDLIQKIVDHHDFQRLRHIKQLGCGDYIFPGAVHTRFNHCIGACYIAKRFCDQLDINAEQREMILVSALLHDIGHGPFSHAFEKIHGDDKDKKVSHDSDWIFKFLYAFADSEEFENITNQNIFLEVIDIFNKKNKNISNSIIASQLDVDRLDYLLRDSHFCGVPYGNIDLEWIINSIIKVEIDNREHIGIVRKGIGAIEHYLLARRLMLQNIYYHGKKNAAEYCMQKFIFYLLESLKSEKKSLMHCIPQFEKSNLGYFLIKLLSYQNNEIEKEIFINSSFKYYRKLTDIDVWYFINKFYSLEINDNNNLTNCKMLAKNLVQRKIPSYYALSPDKIVTSHQLVNKFKKESEKSIREWQINIDTLKTSLYKQDEDPVYIKDEGSIEIITNLSYQSNILNHLSDKVEYKHFLYVDYRVKKQAVKLIEDLNACGCLVYPYVK